MTNLKIRYQAIKLQKLISRQKIQFAFGEFYRLDIFSITNFHVKQSSRLKLFKTNQI